MLRIRTVSAAGAAPDIIGVRPEMSGKYSGRDDTDVEFSDGAFPLDC